MGNQDEVADLLKKIDTSLQRIADEFCRYNECMAKAVGEKIKVDVTGEVRTRS